MKDAELLERLLEGDPLQGADVSPELDGLAQLADLLAPAAATPPITMRASARNDLRTSVIREANRLAAEPPPLLTRLRERITGTAERWAYSSRVATAGGAAAMVLSTGGVAAAADNSLPGDLFYGVKIAVEDVALSFSDAGVPRGTRLLDQSTTRIDEADRAARRDDAVVAGQALALADERTREGAQEYLSVYLDDGDTAVLAELGDWIITTNRRLDLLPPLTGTGASELANLRTTLNRIGQRIEVLTTGACNSCALGVHDDPDAPSTNARGTEADGTPPTPASANSAVDLTFIPPADQPFQACPCVGVAPPGSAAPVGPTDPATGAPTPPPGSGTSPPRRDPGTSSGGSGGGGGGSGSGGGGPLPVPLPDPGPVLDQAPDPVREAVEDVIEQLPSAPSNPGTPSDL